MSGVGSENLIKDLESEFTKAFRKKIDEYYNKSIEDFQRSIAIYGLRKSNTYIHWGDNETRESLAKAVKERLETDGYYVTMYHVISTRISIHLDRPKISLWKRFINKFK